MKTKSFQFAISYISTAFNFIEMGLCIKLLKQKCAGVGRGPSASGVGVLTP